MYTLVITVEKVTFRLTRPLMLHLSSRRAQPRPRLGAKSATIQVSLLSFLSTYTNSSCPCPVALSKENILTEPKTNSSYQTRPPLSRPRNLTFRFKGRFGVGGTRPWFRTRLGVAVPRLLPSFLYVAA